MSHDHCDHLDAFLAGELSADAASRFAAHLEHCGMCRDAIDQQHWIDGLLRSPSRIELESPPAALIELIHQSTPRRRRRARFIAGGIAAAAALVVAVGWTALPNRLVKGPIPVVNNDVAITSIQEPSLPEPAQATFVGGPDVLVVPIESHHPDVTIVRVYRTFPMSYAAQASAVSPTATDLNGG
jgi:hypothetical protein